MYDRQIEEDAMERIKLVPQLRVEPNRQMAWVEWHEKCNRLITTDRTDFVVAARRIVGGCYGILKQDV